MVTYGKWLGNLITFITLSTVCAAEIYKMALLIQLVAVSKYLFETYGCFRK